MMDIDLGATIRRCREERGIAQSKLARMADLPNNTLLRIENGVVTNPGIETIAKIAAALGMEPYELLKPEVAHLPAKRRSKPQRGAVAIGAVLRTALVMSAMLLLPGIAKAAAPIIHRSSPRSSPGRAR